MLKCICAAPRYRVAATECIRSQSSMFNNSFQSKEPLKSGDSGPTNILYLNASHGPQSLVAVGAQILLDNLKGDRSIKEVKLWQNELVQYKIEHAQSKLSILRGEGTQADEERFAPVLEAAEFINTVDLVVIATPMWNYSIPYTLKQYIDTVVQPGINFNDTEDPALTKRRGRAVVVISSAGAEYPPTGPVKDFLNPYLKQIFALMGFTRFHPIFIQGTGYKPKQKSVDWTEQEALKLAAELNTKLTKTEE